MDYRITRAGPDDAQALTELSFASKRVWHDPEAWFELWKEELTITPEYIQNNTVFTARADREIVGYLSLAEVREDFYAGNVLVEKGCWLEHLFVRPDRLRTGIGSLLLERMRSCCRERGITRVRVFSAPHAKGFYLRTGARVLGESASSIPGRSIPVLEYDLQETGTSPAPSDTPAPLTGVVK